MEANFDDLQWAIEIHKLIGFISILAFLPILFNCIKKDEFGIHITKPSKKKRVKPIPLAPLANKNLVPQSVEPSKQSPMRLHEPRPKESHASNQRMESNIRPVANYKQSRREPRSRREDKTQAESSKRGRSNREVKAASEKSSKSRNKNAVSSRETKTARETTWQSSPENVTQDESDSELEKRQKEKLLKELRMKLKQKFDTTSEKSTKTATGRKKEQKRSVDGDEKSGRKGTSSIRSKLGQVIEERKRSKTASLRDDNSSKLETKVSEYASARTAKSKKSDSTKDKLLFTPKDISDSKRDPKAFELKKSKSKVIQLSQAPKKSE